VKERLIEDWLVKVNERGFETPFCQTLIAAGHRIIRFGHSPFEDGKDVITFSAKGGLHAYQLKGGALDLPTFEQHFPQIQALVEAVVDHPRVKAGTKHKPFFVTTGAISLPVLNRVKNLNVAWKQRKYEPLTLIGGQELLTHFAQLSGDFWPIEPPQVRAFLGLYLAKGKGDFDNPEFAKFLHELLTVEPKTAKTKIARRLAAANIFASYVLREFYASEDHWSIFSAWIITASHIAWAAANYNLGVEHWKKPFDLATEAARNALAGLSTETLAPDSLKPRGAELDDFVRARNTIAASAVSAWHLFELRKGTEAQSASAALSLVMLLFENGRLWLWGESALPHFLAIIWFLESSSGSLASDRLISMFIREIGRRTQTNSSDALPDPYEPVDSILTDLFSRIERHPEPSRKETASYALEPLVLMAVRRLLKQTLKSLWYELTEVCLARFESTRSHDLLLWRCNDGAEFHKYYERPQQWDALKAEASPKPPDLLPGVLKDAEFALMFLLIYPHRLSVQLVRHLDHSF